MAKLNRVPLQVSPEFKRKLDEIQKNIMHSQGEKKSLREITEGIIASPLFKDIEKNMIKSGDLKMDIKIKFDRRLLG
jgi:DNA-directed RNA polymerase subunit E'/Rpb7